VPQDPGQAQQWLAKAAGQGHADARVALAGLGTAGPLVAADDNDRFRSAGAAAGAESEIAEDQVLAEAASRGSRAGRTPRSAPAVIGAAPAPVTVMAEAVPAAAPTTPAATLSAEPLATAVAEPAPQADADLPALAAIAMPPLAGRWAAAPSAAPAEVAEAPARRLSGKRHRSQVAERSRGRGERQVATRSTRGKGERVQATRGQTKQMAATSTRRTDQKRELGERGSSGKAASQRDVRLAMASPRPASRSAAAPATERAVARSTSAKAPVVKTAAEPRAQPASRPKSSAAPRR
jgi:hypothetical protein